MIVSWHCASLSLPLCGFAVQLVASCIHVRLIKSNTFSIIFPQLLSLALFHRNHHPIHTPPPHHQHHHLSPTSHVTFILPPFFLIFICLCPPTCAPPLFTKNSLLNKATPTKLGHFWNPTLPFACSNEYMVCCLGICPLTTPKKYGHLGFDVALHLT